MFDLDALAHSNKWSQKSPRKKVFIGVAALVVSLAVSNFHIHLAVAATMSVLIVAGAGISWKAYGKLYIIPLSFLMLGAATMLLSISTTGDGLQWKIDLGGFVVGISAEVMPQIKILISRCIAALSGLYFMTLTTPLNQLVKVLKKVRVPIILIELVVLMYRFIHIFLVSLQESYQALQMKNGFYDMKTSRRSLSLLVVMTYEKMMSSYREWLLVLEIKNFDGDFHV